MSAADKFTLIGQGSEWFWVMAQFVAVTVTLIAIFFQVRTERGATAFEQLHRLTVGLDDELTVRARLAVLLAVRDGGDQAVLPEGAFSIVVNQWVTLGTLVQRGHLSRKTFHGHHGPFARMWWAVLEPYLRRDRAVTGQDDLAIEFEWLADEMAKIDRHEKSTTRYDAAAVAHFVDQVIDGSRDKLTMLAAIGSGPDISPANRVDAPPVERTVPGPDQ